MYTNTYLYKHYLVTVGNHSCNDTYNFLWYYYMSYQLHIFL